MTNENPEALPSSQQQPTLDNQAFQKSSTLDINNNNIEKIEMATAEISDAGDQSAVLPPPAAERTASAQESSLPLSSSSSPVEMSDSGCSKIPTDEMCLPVAKVSSYDVSARITSGSEIDGAIERMTLSQSTNVDKKQQYPPTKIQPSTAPAIPTSGGLLKNNTALPFSAPQYHRQFKPYYDAYSHGQPGIIPNPYGHIPSAYPFPRSDKTTVRFLIPAKAAGAIIGKGGANIKELREKFQALIAIPDASTPERIVRIQLADHKKLMHIIQRIAELLKDDIQKYRRARLSYNNQQEETTEMRMLVHQSQAGAIIGPKGSHVKRINDETGAKINVQTEVCPHSTDKVAQITGTPLAISKAVGVILQLFVNFPPKGNQFFYDPNFYDPSYEYGGYGYTGVTNNFIAIQPTAFTTSPYFPMPQTTVSTPPATTGGSSTNALASSTPSIPNTTTSTGSYPQQIPSFHQLPATSTAVSSALGTPTTQPSPMTSYAPATISSGSGAAGYVYAHPSYVNPTGYMGAGISMYQQAAATAQAQVAQSKMGKGKPDNGKDGDKKSAYGSLYGYPGYYTSPHFYYQPYTHSAQGATNANNQHNTQLRANATPFVMKHNNPNSRSHGPSKKDFDRRKQSNKQDTSSSQRDMMQSASPASKLNKHKHVSTSPTHEPGAGGAGEQKQDS